MYWTEITANGNHAILPPQVRGQGLNTYNSSETTKMPGGAVVVDSSAGSGTVTIGFFVSASDSAAFQAFEDGLMTGADAFVRHGNGVRLAVNVAGITGTLRIGYAGDQGRF